MRALLVELRPERVEAPLLRAAIALRGPRRFGLERLVHPLMPAVLLRVRGLDELGPDAEADPPHAEGGEPRERGRGERHAVVAADALGEPIRAEEPLEDGPGLRGAHRRQRATGEQIARRAVRDREWEAVAAIARLELPLEVGRPRGVRRQHRCRGTARMPEGALATRARDAAVPLEERRGGARRETWELGLSTRQHGHELLAAPGGMPASQRQQRGDHRGCGRRGRVVRAARALEEPRDALGLIPCPHLVAGLAADSVALAQRGHALVRAPDVGDELQALIHRTDLTPRHRAPRRMP